MRTCWLRKRIMLHHTLWSKNGQQYPYPGRPMTVCDIHTSKHWQNSLHATFRSTLDRTVYYTRDGMSQERVHAIIINHHEMTRGKWKDVTRGAFSPRQCTSSQISNGSGCSSRLWPSTLNILLTHPILLHRTSDYYPLAFPQKSLGFSKNH